MQAHEKLAWNIIGIQEFNLEPNLLTKTLEFDAMRRNKSQSYFVTLVQVLILSTNKMLTHESLTFKIILHLKVY